VEFELQSYTTASSRAGTQAAAAAAAAHVGAQQQQQVQETQGTLFVVRAPASAQATCGEQHKAGLQCDQLSSADASIQSQEAECAATACAAAGAVTAASTSCVVH
jgi:hypothetical protein